MADPAAPDGPSVTAVDPTRAIGRPGDHEAEHPDTGSHPEALGLALATPATAPTAATAPADAPAATASAGPADLPDQVVSAVVPLHSKGDGRHQITLELRPDDLGAIRVEVTVEHQTVHLTLHTADPSTGRLLAAALPDLRAALADAGLTAGHIGVGPGGDGHAGNGPHDHGQSNGDNAANQRASDTRPRRGPGPNGATTDGTGPARSGLSGSGRLDLFL